MSEEDEQRSKFKIFLTNMRHYKMERFAISFIAIFVALMVVIGLCFKYDYDIKSNLLSDKAIYTTSFQTSKTEIPGKVEGVYSSNDKTKVFLLMNFSDVSQLSTDANQYRVFVTGANVPHNDIYVHGNPAGSVYIFGTTGYMGVYLVDHNGFTPQILDLTIRSLKQLKAKDLPDPNDPTAKSDSDKAYNDPSFDKNDQFRVYFNPGASGTTKIDCLNNDSVPSIRDLYDQTVGTKTVETSVVTLKNDLNQMSTTLDQIHEYTRRLDEQDNVQVPEPPAFIAGDKVTRVTHGTDDPSDDTYKLHFKKVAKGGYRVNWQGKPYTYDYLGDAMEHDDAEDMTIEQYFAKKVADRNDNSSSSSDGSDYVSNIVWTMKDGTKLESLNTGSGIGRYNTINKDVQNLISAWQKYTQLKVQYQTSDLERLIGANAMSKMVTESTTINTKDNVLKIY